jgi:conjugative relaxase-like TrwC/TraI family protein
MLSIKALKLSDENYYLDYYLAGIEPPGQWIGGGCKHLGLSGTVTRDAFRRLFRGYHPLGGGSPEDPPEQRIALVQSAGKQNRQPGWDLTFSAPKSVSVIWSQASPDMRERIEQLHHEAIKSTFDFIEENFAFSRTGKAGRGDPVKVKLAVSVFEHGSSRAIEPQLHSHTIAHNVGVDASDPNNPKYRTIISKHFYKRKMLSGAYYRAKLAQLLHAGFGFEAERKRNEFDIRGVPQDLNDAHSTRRHETVAELERKGASGAKAAEEAALNTRKKKKKQFPREMLFPEWQKTNALYGFDTAAVERLVRPRPTDYAQFVPKILKRATKTISRNRSHFTLYEFLREALYEAPQFGVPPELVVEAAHKYLNESPKIVPIPTQNRYTTEATLKEEVALLDAVGKLRQSSGVRVNNSIFSDVIARHSQLNEQQQAAIKHITQGDGSIRIVQGYAGVGKTTMLRAAVEAWKDEECNVVGACFTGAAAQKLQDEIGIPCDTINMTLADFNADWSDSAKRYLKHTAKQFARATRKKPTFKFGKPKRPDINKRTIVLLDEAGMINTRHMRMLAEWVKENNATLVLVGDPAQLAAIEGGSPLQSLSKRVGCKEVTEIKRQQDEWARSAAHFMATGRIGEALALYEKRNLVKVEDDLEQAMKRLINDWIDYAYDRPERATILTLTNKQVEKANHLAQQKRIEKGVLDPKNSHTIFSHNKRMGKTHKSNVHINDRVVFTETNRTYNVWNGNAGTVIGFTHYKSVLKPAIKVRLDNGSVVTVPLSFRQIRLGYASTVHRAQGATIPVVFVLLGGSGQNLPTSYVQGTRSELATRFYTERALYDELRQDIEDSPLVSEMEREVDLSLASDLFTPVLDTAPTREALIDRVLDHAVRHLAAGEGRSLIITPTAAESEAIHMRCMEINYAMAQVDSETKRKLANLQKNISAHRTLLESAQLQQEQVQSWHEQRSHNLAQKQDAPHPTIDELVYTISDPEVLAHLERLRVMSQHEAQASRCNVQNAYILPPDAGCIMTSPYSATHYEYSHVWSPTVFDTPISNTSYGVQAQNSFLFTQQQQMAADWQQKMAQVNQATPCYVQQQQYLSQLVGPTDHRQTIYQYRI